MLRQCEDGGMGEDNLPSEEEEPETAEQADASPALAEAEADLEDSQAQLAASRKRLNQVLQTRFFPSQEAYNRSVLYLDDALNSWTNTNAHLFLPAREFPARKATRQRAARPSPSESTQREAEAAQIVHLAEVAESNRKMSSAIDFLREIAQQQLATAIDAETRARADQRWARWTTVIALVVAVLSLGTSVLALLVASA